jgi:hypothetical protein
MKWLGTYSSFAKLQNNEDKVAVLKKSCEIQQCVYGPASDE